MMSFDKYLAKFFYVAVFSCLITAAFLVGCGGGNNPTGPTSTSLNAASTALPTTATGSATLSGFLISASTGNLIVSTTAKIRVTATLVGTTFSKFVDSTQNQAFTIFDLPSGNYLIEIEDLATPKEYEKISLIKEVSGTKVDVTVQLSPTSLPPGRVNFVGKVIDAAFAKPIQFVTVKVKSNSGSTFETTTLFDGSFSLMGLASGTYGISFNKSGFETASRTLVLSDTEIRIGTKKLDSVTDFTAFTDGSNTAQSGYNLGNIIVAPLVAETGGISGILLDNNKNPLVSQALDLVYDSNTNDAIRPASIIPNFKTNSLGYFMAKNLPAGFYLVAYPNYQLFPILDGTGNTVGYNFGTGGAINPSVLVTRVWLEVKPGSVTPIPELE